jgi:hypothetical protein
MLWIENIARGRPSRGWENNIRMLLGEIGWSGMGWIYLNCNMNQWRALVNRVMNLILFISGPSH